MLIHTGSVSVAHMCLICSGGVKGAQQREAPRLASLGPSSASLRAVDTPEAPLPEPTAHVGAQSHAGGTATCWPAQLVTLCAPSASAE